MAERRSERPFYATSRYVRELASQDFDDTVVWKLDGDVAKTCGVVLFYTPWCGHCRRLKRVYEQSARRAAFADFWAFNCEKHAEHAGKIRSDMPNLVPEFPTIVAYQHGVPVEALAPPYAADRLDQLAMRTCDGESDDKMRNHGTATSSSQSAP